MGAYAFFVKICREEHKKRFPDEVVEFNEFTKKCAERWKTMTDKEKGKFHQMAELDRKRLSTEITTFNTNNDGVKKKRTRRAKDPRAPKRSMYVFFDTVKLGIKELLNKEQIGNSEPFPVTICQFTS